MCFSKKKLVSGFVLALVSVSNFVFVLFFNYNFTNPISNEHFFHGISINNNGSHIAWSFSFNTTSSPNYTYSFSAAVLSKNVTQVDQNLHHVDDILNTHLGNFSNDVKNGSFNGVPKKVLDIKDTQLMKLKDDAKNRSFIRFPKKVVDFEDIQLMKLRDDAKNRSSTRFPKVVDFEDTHLMKLKNDVKNGSFGAIVVNPKKGEVVINQENGNGIFVGFRDVDSKNKKGDNGDGDHAKVLRSYGSSFEECDIFDGKWVRDDTKPYYPAGSCRYVERAFNCYRNNRPDRKFVKWRWQPFGCQIPSLNATDFLERLRGKKLVFVGDSINRNMCESLICILRNSLTDRGRAYEISKGIEFQKQGHRAFKFVDYNFTMDYVKSPFLVRQSSYKGKHGLFGTLRLDLMDSTTSMYKDADILIFNTGHWWTPEKTSKGNNFYQEGNHVHPRLEVLDAYTRALSTWATWVDNHIDSQKTQVFYRGDSVNHFGGGRWNSGGQCHSETEPIFNTSQLKKYPPRMRIFDHYLQVMKTPVAYLNISRLTDYRKDGHPSIYRRLRRPIRLRFNAKPPQDCSHWCLPGVPDTWNELFYASLLKVGRGSWKS